MKVDINTNSAAVRRALKEAGDQVQAKMKRGLSRAAQQGIVIIQDRMDKGKEIEGSKFKPYTEKYAAFRKKEGKQPFPNLQFTRGMRNAMTTKASRKKAEIFFTTGDEAKKAAFNDKSRPFFGFNNDEEDTLGKIFFKAVT